MSGIKIALALRRRQGRSAGMTQEKLFALPSDSRDDDHRAAVGGLEGPGTVLLAGLPEDGFTLAQGFGIEGVGGFNGGLRGGQLRR